MPNCPRPSTSIADISHIYRATCAPSAQRAPLTSRISGWPKSVKQLAVPHRLDPLAICPQSTPKPSSLPTRNKALRIRTRVPIARRLPKRTNTTLGWLVRAVWVLRKGGANRSRGGPLSEFFSLHGPESSPLPFEVHQARRGSFQAVLALFSRRARPGDSGKEKNGSYIRHFVCNPHFI